MSEGEPLEPGDTRQTKIRDADLHAGLYLVPTPIGNLEDITLRALRVLRDADRIACEDTRQTQKLLNHFSIGTPTVSYHLHNERERAEELMTDLLAGGRIAVVSDAGMPGIADPGADLVAAAVKAGIPVFSLPGANAALTALVASGLNAEAFQFRGFLPSKSGERKTLLESVRQELRPGSAVTQIFYETPHRIADALGDIVTVYGGGHRMVLARELTKLHEEFLRGTAAEVLATLQARPVVRGEMVLLLDGTCEQAAPSSSMSLADSVRKLVRDEGISEKDALKRVARERSIGKSEAYREWQRSSRRA